MRRRRRYSPWIYVWVALGVVLLALFVYWLSHRGTPAGPGAGGSRSGARGGPGAGGAPSPVGVQTARVGTMELTLQGLGTVTPRATVTVHTRVAGQLMRVDFTEGQMVKAGQLLAEVDPRPYEAALEQAEGQLAHDQALLAGARIDLERYQTLFQQDSIAKQTLDDQAALVQQDEGAVKADQGNVATARVNLTYTRIVAPVAGRVGLRQVDAGNIVQPSDNNGVVVITQVQPVDVVYTLPQEDIPRVLHAMKRSAQVPADAYGSDLKTLLDKGHLLTIDNLIDQSSGTVKLKATFDNAHNELFPNQFVNVRMTVGQLENAVIVPVAAVQRGSQGLFAYVVKPDHTVTVRPVTITATEGDSDAIGSGLAGGDVVVVDGTDKLREGAKVEPIDRSVTPAGVAPTAPARTGHGRHGGPYGKGGAAGPSETEPAPGPDASTPAAGAAPTGNSLTAPAGTGPGGGNAQHPRAQEGGNTQNGSTASGS